MTDNSKTPSKLLFEKLAINFDEVPFEQLCHYTAVEYFLMIEDRPLSNANNLEKVRQYTESFDHLCKAADWKRANEILSCCLNTDINQKLGNQLGIWGYYQEQIEMYSQIIGKLDSHIDAEYWQIIGRANSYLGNYQDAIKCHQESFKLFQKLKDEENSAWSLQALGITYMDIGKDEDAQIEFQKALQLFNKLKKRMGIASILHNLARIESNQGNYQKAVQLYQECLNIFPKEVENEELAWIFHNFGRTLINQGELEKGRQFTEKGLNLFKDNKTGKAWSLYSLSLIMLNLNDNRSAQINAEKALAIFRDELNNKSGIAWSIHVLGRVAFRKKDYETSHKYYQEKLEIHQESRNWHGIAYTLEGFASLAAALNQPKRAARLFGATESLREKYKFFLPPYDRSDYDGIEANLKNQIDEITFAATKKVGKELSEEQMISEVLSKNN